jgi:aspartokinase-like uncharacterized kinase
MIHRSTPPVILKIGGSLAEGDHLRAWLGLAADHGDQSIIIVPGGGPFADQVRAAQPRLGFSDAIAHRMALLGMEQYAIAMSGMEPRLRLASSPITLERALLRHEAALWLPSAMALGRPDLPESWEVTSDSLACWLASELCARRVVLIKSSAPAQRVSTADALARAGYVDAAFPGFLKRFRGEAAYMTAADHSSAAAALSTGRDFGTAIQP